MSAPFRVVGAVVGTHADGIEISIPRAKIGDGASVRTAAGTLFARVAAVGAGSATLTPFGMTDGIGVGDRVELDPSANTLVLGTALLGRAFDPSGDPLDRRPRPNGVRSIVPAVVPDPVRRTPVDTPAWTGVRVIDGLLTIGRGARVGLFGAPGCGKSTLLEAIVRGTRADATVIALVGERGREAERWLRDVGPRSSLICATSDRSAAERVRAAEVAFAQADRLRARGLHVLLVVDSLARVVTAAREKALALGEPAGRGGYPPSVFAGLARLVEGAGAADGGAITLIATVLSDGGDEREPLSDAARSLLDGHIVLSEALARRGHYPAVDPLKSTSRTMGDVVSAEHAYAARRVRAAIALLEETEEARRLGLETGQLDPVLVRARLAEARLEAFLQQGPESSSPGETLQELIALADTL